MFLSFAFFSCSSLVLLFSFLDELNQGTFPSSNYSYLGYLACVVKETSPGSIFSLYLSMPFTSLFKCSGWLLHHFTPCTGRGDVLIGLRIHLSMYIPNLSLREDCHMRIVCIMGLWA